MATKADEAVSQVLAKALEAPQVTGDFVVEQAPDVVQQLLLWELASSCIWAAAILLAITLVWLGRRWLVSLDDYDDEGRITTAFIAAVITSFLSVPLLFNIAAALKVLVAPNIFLLEYAASLIK